MDKFWMVLADNSSQTTKRHHTQPLAIGEAKRLAGQNPGVKFFVLEAVGVAEKPDPVTFETIDEIPF